MPIFAEDLKYSSQVLKQGFSKKSVELCILSTHNINSLIEYKFIYYMKLTNFFKDFLTVANMNWNWIL